MVKYRCVKCNVGLSNVKLKHRPNSSCPHKEAVFLEIVGVKYVHPITQETVFETLSGKEHLSKLGGGVYIDLTKRDANKR